MMNFHNPNDFWMHNNYDPYKGLNDDERLDAGCLQLLSFVSVLFIGMLICLLFCGCTTTQYVPVVEYHTDTLIQTKVKHDSIHVKDSTIVEKGDSIIKIEHWHTKYIEKQVHDTTYISKTDSVPQPYPVEKKVPAELTWWQQTRLHIANVVLWTLGLSVVFWFCKKKMLP